MSFTTPPATTLATASSTSTSFLTTPLLTLFTEPTSCNPTSISTWNSCASASGTWTCAPLLDDSCLPLPSSKLSTAICSPGVCPTSYYAAGVSGLPDAATTAWCCPSGAIYNSGSCASRITGAYATTASFGATTTATNLVVTTADAGIAVFIGVFPTIQVAWAVSDLPFFTPASAPLLANEGGQNTSSPSSSATASATSPPHSSGLSTAAQAGIGVGTAVFAIALLVLGGLLLLRRRKRQPAMNGDHGAPAEMPGNDMDLEQPRFPYAELGQDGVVGELAVDDKSPTAYGRQSVWHEMEGDFTPVEISGNAPPIGVRFPRIDERDEVKS